MNWGWTGIRQTQESQIVVKAIRALNRYCSVVGFMVLFYTVRFIIRYITN